MLRHPQGVDVKIDDQVRILHPRLAKFNLEGTIVDKYDDGEYLVAFQFRFTEQLWTFKEDELEVV